MSVMEVDEYIYTDIDYTMMGDIAQQFGDQYCAIIINGTVLKLGKQIYQQANQTGRRVVNCKDSYINLPDGFRGKYTRFCAYNNVLYVFVLDENMQTCAVYNFITDDYIGGCDLDTDISPDAYLSSVKFTMANTIQLHFNVDDTEFVHCQVFDIVFSGVH
jgi:hypothetical protein